MDSVSTGIDLGDEADADTHRECSLYGRGCAEETPLVLPPCASLSSSSSSSSWIGGLPDLDQPHSCVISDDGDVDVGPDFDSEEQPTKEGVNLLTPPKSN